MLHHSCGIDSDITLASTVASTATSWERIPALQQALPPAPQGEQIPPALQLSRIIPVFQPGRMLQREQIPPALQRVLPPAPQGEQIPPALQLPRIIPVSRMLQRERIPPALQRALPLAPQGEQIPPALQLPRIVPVFQAARMPLAVQQPRIPPALQWAWTPPALQQARIAPEPHRAPIPPPLQQAGITPALQLARITPGAVLVFVGSNFLTEPNRKRLRQIGRNQMGFGAHCFDPHMIFGHNLHMDSCKVPAYYSLCNYLVCICGMSASVVVSEPHSGTSTGTNRSRTSTGSNPPGPSTGANDSGAITDPIPSSTAAPCANRTGASSCSTFTGANLSRTSTSRFCDLASISGAYQSCGVNFGITGASAAPSVTSISTNASGTSTGTNHSAALTGGALGGAFGIVALIVAVIYQYFKVLQPLPISVAHLLTISQAPSPSASSDYYFWFVLPSPIKFRGKTLQDAQPDRLALTETKPERGFTLSGSRRHELVAWKVFTLSAGEEGQHVRLPRNLGFGDVKDSEGSLAADRFFNFAPLRTLVTRTKEGSWKSAQFIIPGLTAMVVGKNAALQPVDFALGTYHAKRGKTEGIFHPFGVVRRVLNSQFCVVPQCEELVVNAYITQSIDQRQLLTDFFDTNEDPNAAPLPAIEDDDNRLISGSQQDLNAAPRPIVEDDDTDDLSPKILSSGLLGANGFGQPVSSLNQRTRWDLVDDDQGVRLKMVTDARGHKKQWNDRGTYI
ncbi:hypothetical protein DFH08DRAFT_798073 [Mycena albidolilacea]|uniref:Uncharacterized protein n=1 Tax=Mycena albidolilacea TaxID=1033008 RepID=A0AAD7F5C3_9AGAR|nr:hypothetical protein DFH08DRAFT_798073 [Mycena albidolilacea]